MSKAKSLSSLSGKTPKDAYFETLDAFQEAKGFKGSMLVRGVDSDKSEDKLTDKDLSKLRFIMQTDRREEKYNDMHDLVLGEQAGSSFLMFSTRFSYDVQDIVLGSSSSSSSSFKRLYTKATTTDDEKYDLLLGLTMALEEHNTWMHDNEGDMAATVKALAAMWKTLLKKTNAELGMDAEYTRPGTVAFLQDFKKMIEQDSEGLGKFNFK